MMAQWHCVNSETVETLRDKIVLLFVCLSLTLRRQERAESTR
jgi:hypothetical protein